MNKPRDFFQWSEIEPLTDGTGSLSLTSLWTWAASSAAQRDNAIDNKTNLWRVACPSWPRSWGRGDPGAPCGPSHTGLARWPHTACARSCRRLETENRGRTYRVFICGGLYLRMHLRVNHVYKGRTGLGELNLNRPLKKMLVWRGKETWMNFYSTEFSMTADKEWEQDQTVQGALQNYCS